MNDGDDKPGRREALEVSAIACGAGVAALAAWPLGAALLGTSPDAQREAPWVDLGAEAALREGEAVKAFPTGLRRDGWTVASHELSALWLVRQGGTAAASSSRSAASSATSSAARASRRGRASTATSRRRG